MSKLVFALFAVMSCDPRPDPQVVSRTRGAEQAIAEGLKVGADKDQVRAFLMDQGWSFAFDDHSHCFAAEVCRTELHTVRAELCLSNKGEFLRSKVAGIRLNVGGT